MVVCLPEGTRDMRLENTAHVTCDDTMLDKSLCAITPGDSRRLWSQFTCAKVSHRADLWALYLTSESFLADARSALCFFTSHASALDQCYEVCSTSLLKLEKLFHVECTLVGGVIDRSLKVELPSQPTNSTSFPNSWALSLLSQRLPCLSERILTGS